MEILNSNKLLNISICADDYGYNFEVNSSIIKLIKKKIITHTSCIIYQQNNYIEGFNELKDRAKDVNIGLHLLFINDENNNNYELNNYKNTFRKYLIRSHLSYIDKNKIIRLINNQLDYFEKFFSFQPKFIDSHMHIHQFPKISNILLNILIKRYSSSDLNKIWIRNTQNYNIKKNNIKSNVLSYYGKNFKKKLINFNIKTNKNFIGCYEFKDNFKIKIFYERILKNIVNGTLLMSHPGFYNSLNKHTDDIYKFRQLEYNFLSSSEFKKLLVSNNIVINSSNNILL